MKLDINKTISYETIYQFIYNNKAKGGKLYKYLRHKNKKYHNPKGRGDTPNIFAKLFKTFYLVYIPSILDVALLHFKCELANSA